MFIDEIKEISREAASAKRKKKEQELQEWFHKFSIAFEEEIKAAAKKGYSYCSCRANITEDMAEFVKEHYKEQGFVVQLSGPYCVCGASAMIINVSWQEDGVEYAKQTLDEEIGEWNEKS